MRWINFNFLIVFLNTGTFKTLIMKLIYTILIFILLSACVSQNVEDLVKNIPNKNSFCDTTDFSKDTIFYHTHIVPLLQKNCLSCHSAVKAPNYGGGYNWEDSTEFALYALDLNQVLPAISHTGSVQMPQNAPKLSDCDINTVSRWIDLNK